MSDWWNAILGLLFPPCCVRCGREGSWFCAKCRRAAQPSLVRWCPECGASCQPDSHTGKKPFWFDELWSLLPYQQPWVAASIHRMKYGGTSAIATFFGSLLVEVFYKQRGFQSLESDLVTAIPMYRKRERSRGFNQAETIARSFAARGKLPYARLLARIRKTGEQARRGREERQHNLTGSFAVAVKSLHRGTTETRDRDRQLVFRKKTVILVDDVVTTGATLSEASRVLKQSGCARVIALTVAYSERQRKGR